MQEDANSAGNAVADFFDDQPVTELFESITVTVKTQATAFTGVKETISNKFPEIFITDLYPDVFHVTVEGTTTIAPVPTITVNAIEFFDAEGGGLVATDTAVPATISANSDYTEWTARRGGDDIVLSAASRSQTLDIEDVTHYFELNTTNTVLTVTLGAFLAGNEASTVGEAHVFKVDDLLTDFNAIDWDALEDGGFSTTIPESFDGISDITDTVSYPQYLWLLEKGEEKGSTGKINSRDLAVFVLKEVVADTTNTEHFNLTFRRLS